MDSYLNEENNIKAAKVRKLIKEGNRADSGELWDQADTLSLELVEYLKKNYPDKFNIQIYDLPNYIQYIDMGILTLNKLINWMPEINLEIHNVGIIRWNYPKDTLNMAVTLFQDEKLELNKYPDNFLMPPENFYNFCESMGLTMKAASKLYKVRDYKGEYPNFPTQFVTIGGLWPDIIQESKKI